VEDLYPASVVRFLDFLGVFDLYHSWWFVLLLFLLCMNLFVCTFDRLPKYFRLFIESGKGEAPPTVDSKFCFSRKLETKNWKAAEAALQKGILGFKNVSNGAEDWVCFSKVSARLSAFNVVIVHLGVLVIMLGALLGAVFGFSGRMALQEGRTSNTVNVDRNDGSILSMPLPFSVMLKSFRVEFYEGKDSSRPKMYSSEVELTKRGQKVASSSIQVNSPLSLDGINLYQASYSDNFKIIFVLQDLKKKTSTEVAADIRERVEFPGTGISVMAVNFMEDLQMNDHGRSVGPAARIHVFGAGGGMNPPQWVLRDHPDFSGEIAGRYRVVLKDFDRSYTSVLEVSRNPGIGVIFLGSALLVLGFLLVAFYRMEKTWVVVDRRAGSIVLTIHSRHLPINAKMSIDKLQRQLERLSA
jgi:cytochrome c biogenesis protein